MYITTRDYLEYYRFVAQTIGTQGDYITALDAAIGDGDHWYNLNNGFRKLFDNTDSLEAETDFKSFFTKLARAIMSCMGGTSGALYGTMYLQSAKCIGQTESIDINQLSQMITCWGQAIMMCGDVKPGQKTMLDAIVPAAAAFADASERRLGDTEALDILKASSEDGAMATKNMKASKGRASTHPTKGVGHLDAGAVTMAIQLGCMADYFANL